MVSYSEMINGITCKFADKIKRSCNPLFEFFNLNYFWHYKITNDGHFGFLGSNIPWNEYFGDQKFYLNLPYLRHPKHLQDGLILMKDINYSDFNEVLRASSEHFDLNLSLQLNIKTSDGIEAWGFSSSSSNELQIRMLLKDLPLLRLFVNKFKEDNEFILSRFDDYKINLAELIGPAFFEKTIPLSVESNKRRDFLQKMGIDTGDPLTSRETDVVKLLLQGHSAGKIAPQIYLSKRTVEHHIERIKNKLSCFSKAELIQKARELEQLGFFGSYL